MDRLGLAPPVAGQQLRAQGHVAEDHVLDAARAAHEHAEPAVRVGDDEVREDAVADRALVVGADPDRDRARRQRAVGDDHALRAEKRDAVVAGVDVAAEDPHVVALDEVDPVVVRHAPARGVGVDAHGLDRDVLALPVVGRPGRRVLDRDPMHEHVAALEEAHEVARPLAVGDRAVLEQHALRHEGLALAREAAVEVARVVGLRRVVERERVAVDRAAADDRHPLGVARGDESAALRLAARVLALDGVVLEPGRGEERGSRLELERDEARQLDRPDRVAAG